MKVERTGFEGLFVIEPKVVGDSRGSFMESYNRSQFVGFNLEFQFVQDNQSQSIKNVVRGLHFQKYPFAQTKLVRALHGKVLDVVVDIRRDQPTFGKIFSIELSDENKKQLLIPRGFAHGFSVLSDSATIFYKCDEYYHPEAEGGICFNDSQLKIDWRINVNDAIVSDRDSRLPTLSTLPALF